MLCRIPRLQGAVLSRAGQHAQALVYYRAAPPSYKHGIKNAPGSRHSPPLAAHQQLAY